MGRKYTVSHVTAPDPDAKTSPIIDLQDEESALSYLIQEEGGFCYFNNATYDPGSFVISGNGDLLHCQKGVWVKEN